MKNILYYLFLPCLFIAEMTFYLLCEHQSIPLISIGYCVIIYVKPSIIQHIFGTIFICASLSIQAISIFSALLFIFLTNIIIYLSRLWLYSSFFLSLFLTFLVQNLYMILHGYPWTLLNFIATIIIIWFINLFCIRLVRQSREEYS
jgi:hypothetical protein